MLVIKTGLTSEFRIAKRYADPSVLVLTGMLTVADLQRAVPSNATGIISFGLCGGLSGRIKVGWPVIASVVDTPDGEFLADADWQNRLHRCTGAPGVRWWSSGQFNTADTKPQRDALFAQTRCEVIDDETYAVAQFAGERGICFAALRTASDADTGPTSTLPPAVVDALNANGTDNIEAVIKSVVKDPEQIFGLIATAFAYIESLDALKKVAAQVGGNFQWMT